MTKDGQKVCSTITQELCTYNQIDGPDGRTCPPNTLSMPTKMFDGKTHIDVINCITILSLDLNAKVAKKGSCGVKF